MCLIDTFNGYINCLSGHMYFLNCCIQLKLILFYSVYSCNKQFFLVIQNANDDKRGMM